MRKKNKSNYNMLFHFVKLCTIDKQNPPVQNNTIHNFRIFVLRWHIRYFALRSNFRLSKLLITPSHPITRRWNETTYDTSIPRHCSMLGPVCFGYEYEADVRAPQRVDGVLR